MANRSADPNTSSSAKRTRQTPKLLTEFVVGDGEEEYQELFDELHREGEGQPREDDHDTDLDDPFEELDPPPARPFEAEEDEEDDKEEEENKEKSAKKSKKKTDDEKRTEAVETLERLGFDFDQTLDEADHPLSQHYTLDICDGEARHLPRGLDSALDFFRLFFTDVMARHLMECGNVYLQGHAASRFDPTLVSISKNDVDNFLALYFALCLVNFTPLRTIQHTSRLL